MRSSFSWSGEVLWDLLGPCLSHALPLGPASQEVLGWWGQVAGRCWFHQCHCPPPKVACGMGREVQLVSSLVSQVPATLSFKAMSQPSASSPSLGAHRSLLPVTSFREGPSRKACRCPLNPEAQDPLIGRPQPQPHQALRNSFAWPWNCPRGNRRNGSGEDSRRRRTCSGSCGSRSQSIERPAPGRAVRATPPPAFVTYLFINCLLLSLRPGALGVGLHWRPRGK